MKIHQTDTLNYKNKVVFQRLIISHFNRVPKEYYENEACFVFVNEGELSIRTANNFIHLANDSGILAKCAPYFCEISQESFDQKIELVGILLYPEIIEDLFNFSLFDSNYKINYNTKKVIIDQQLQSYKESILFLFNNKELADEAMIGVKLKEFILIISKIEHAPSSLDFLSALFQPAKFNFKNVIEQNLFSDLSIEQLAHLTNMSLSSFKRKFREVFNDSPIHYINSKKVERAIFKILSSNAPISQIAYEVGYGSLATFNRNFKKITGKSPTEFKSSQKDRG